MSSISNLPQAGAPGVGPVQVLFPVPQSFQTAWQQHSQRNHPAAPVQVIFQPGYGSSSCEQADSFSMQSHWQAVQADIVKHMPTLVLPAQGIQGPAAPFPSLSNSSYGEISARLLQSWVVGSAQPVQQWTLPPCPQIVSSLHSLGCSTSLQNVILSGEPAVGGKPASEPSPLVTIAESPGADSQHPASIAERKTRLQLHLGAVPAPLDSKHRGKSAGKKRAGMQVTPALAEAQKVAAALRAELAEDQTNILGKELCEARVSQDPAWKKDMAVTCIWKPCQKYRTIDTLYKAGEVVRKTKRKLGTR